MTIVKDEKNGNNGRHAGGVWRGGRCPSSLDTRAGALARVGRIVRRNEALVPKLHRCPSMAVALPVPLFFPRQFEVCGLVTRD